MNFAGPVEFSTADIALALLVLVGATLAVPILVGGVALYLYKRRTPHEEQDSRTARLTFFRAFALGLVAQVVLGAAFGGIAELIG